jgi:protein SCO1/2
MEDRIVILNFVFTSCATICPALSAIMRSTEQQLSERLGKDVILISISVDPANDTPDKLRDYAKKIGSGTNWYWLTGNPVDIEYALRAFGVPTGGRPENHPPTILVGNTRKNQWWRWVGITTPESLVNAVNAFTNNASPSNKRSHAR